MYGYNVSFNNLIHTMTLKKDATKYWNLGSIYDFYNHRSWCLSQ